MKNRGRLILVTSLLLLILLACRQARPSRRASLGDTWTRPNDGMVMVYVPAGTFEMGSSDADIDAALELCREDRETCQRETFADEQPAHTVSLDDFWIDQTEVSNRQYRQCVEAEACEEPGCGEADEFNADEQPVVCVTWHQADAYCAWAGGRLPTEAEWEYTARGPEGHRYPWGDAFDGTRLNYCDVNCPFQWADQEVDDGYTYTAPVGTFPDGASWCGALDMAGNVWEWVADWHGQYPDEPQENPTGPSGIRRVVRGGAWDLDRAFVRSALRNWGLPDSVSNVSGFRCVFPEGDSQTAPSQTGLGR